MKKFNYENILTIILIITSITCIFVSNIKHENIIKCDKLISIYDGDTFKCRVNAMPKDFEIVSFRVLGVDTPEIRNKDKNLKTSAIQAREFTKKFLNSGSISITNIKKGKYFRFVARISVNGKYLDQELIRAGLGKPYLIE